MTLDAYPSKTVLDLLLEAADALDRSSPGLHAGDANICECEYCELQREAREKLDAVIRRWS